MIEVLMQVRKDKYKDNPVLSEGLDLVEEEEQITHEIQLEEDLKVEEGLSKYIFLCFGLSRSNLLARYFQV
jgi:pre-mRNA-splicing factor CWC22